MTDDDAHDDNVVSFNLNDGTSWRLVGWRSTTRWVEDLNDAWAWARDELKDPDPVAARPNMLSVLDTLQRDVKAARTSGQPPSTVGDLIRRLLNQTYGPFHQTSENGARIADIAAEAGPDAAMFAFAFLRQQVAFGHISTLSHFQGLMLLAQPSLAVLHNAGERLSAERNNYRTATRRLSSEIEEADRRRHKEWDESLVLAGQSAMAWSQRRARRWLRYTTAWRGVNQRSVDSIRAVESSYREAMALQAPVEYWTTKANGHKVDEEKALHRLFIYFPVALVLITGLFGASAIYLLSVPQAKLPPGLYVIASAGLASAAGLLFWIGRLLTKLYLSEHHLRHDAEERAVMTTTYLALTAEQAASDADRQIILTSLFRTTSDGIVKEEGTLDPSLASLIAKIGVR